MIRASLLRTAIAASLVGAIAACVDLFHATDFAEPCGDTATCASDGGVDATSAEASIEETKICAASSTEARQIAGRVCGRLGACFGNVEGSTFGACMLRALAAYDCVYNPSLRPKGATALQWGCLTNATTCDEVATCLFPEGRPTCQPSDAGATTTCGSQAGAVVECADASTPLGIEPCALEGRTCARVDGTTSICAGKQAAACGDAPRCEGTFAVACKKVGGLSFDEGTDCATVGSGTCAADGVGVGCVPGETAAACKGDSTLRCTERGAVEGCVGGRVVRFDCGQIGAGCDVSGASPTDPSTACRNVDAGPCAETNDVCASTKLLRSCARGMSFDVDCETLGLDGCTPFTSRPACGPPL